MPEPSFTCPFCGKVSHNRNDAAQRYCGACHVFVDYLGAFEHAAAAAHAEVVREACRFVHDARVTDANPMALMRAVDRLETIEAYGGKIQAQGESREG